MDDFTEAVESALPSVASVVCKIIADYAAVERHRWQDISTDVGTATTHTGQSCRWYAKSETELVCESSTKTTIYGWRMFVSAADLRYGARTWTIDFLSNRYAGAGMTASWSNRIFEGLRYGWSMLSDDLQIFQDDRITSIQHTYRFDAPVRFVADPLTLQVFAIYKQSTIVLLKAASIDAFYELRPCVIFGETGDATIHQ